MPGAPAPLFDLYHPAAVVLSLTPLDRRTLTAIRTAGAFTEDADVVKVALWRLGEALGLDVPVDAFALPYSGRLDPLRLRLAELDGPLTLRAAVETTRRRRRRAQGQR